MILLLSSMNMAVIDALFDLNICSIGNISTSVTISQLINNASLCTLSARSFKESAVPGESELAGIVTNSHLMSSGSFSMR